MDTKMPKCIIGTMVKERIEIEEQYVKSLRNFVLRHTVDLKDDVKSTVAERRVLQHFLKENNDYLIQREKLCWQAWKTIRSMTEGSNSNAKEEILSSLNQDVKDKYNGNETQKIGEIPEQMIRRTRSWKRKKYDVKMREFMNNSRCNVNTMNEPSDTLLTTQVLKYHKFTDGNKGNDLVDTSTKKITDGNKGNDLVDTSTVKFTDCNKANDLVDTSTVKFTDRNKANDLVDTSTLNHEDTDSNYPSVNIPSELPSISNGMVRRKSSLKICGTGEDESIESLLSQAALTQPMIENKDEISPLTPSFLSSPTTANFFNFNKILDAVPERPLTAPSECDDDDDYEEVRCHVLYPFQGCESGEMGVEEGEELIVVHEDDGNSWTRVMRVADEGYVPTSYLQWI